MSHRLNTAPVLALLQRGPITAQVVALLAGAGQIRAVGKRSTARRPAVLWGLVKPAEAA